MVMRLNDDRMASPSRQVATITPAISIKEIWPQHNSCASTSTQIFPDPNIKPDVDANGNELHGLPMLEQSVWHDDYEEPSLMSAPLMQARLKEVTIRQTMLTAKLENVTHLKRTNQDTIEEAKTNFLLLRTQANSNVRDASGVIAEMDVIHDELTKCAEWQEQYIKQMEKLEQELADCRAQLPNMHRSGAGYEIEVDVNEAMQQMADMSLNKTT